MEVHLLQIGCVGGCISKIFYRVLQEGYFPGTLEVQGCRSSRGYRLSFSKKNLL